MQNPKTWLLILMAVALVGGFAMQQQSIKRLQQELTSIRNEMTAVGQTDHGSRLPSEPARSKAVSGDPSAGLAARLARLEQAVTELTRSSEHLMVRGRVPPSTAMLEEMQRTFFNANATDRERLDALRTLGRTGSMTDDMAEATVNWLHSSTNRNFRENVLQQLGGMTNAVLREPLLQLAMTDADAKIRERAVQNLRHFADDPSVEAQLWSVLQKDTDADVRKEADEALRRAPATEPRLASLRERALNSQAPLEERITAMRALRDAKADISEVTAALSQLAQNSQDPLERARLFRAFDGTRDPALAAPLVQGLQDPSPVVRQEAVDALRHLKSDPAVEQWLRHVAQTDADQRVRREALRALDNRN